MLRHVLSSGLRRLLSAVILVLLCLALSLVLLPATRCTALISTLAVLSPLALQSLTAVLLGTASSCAATSAGI